MERKTTGRVLAIGIAVLSALVSAAMGAVMLQSHVPFQTAGLAVDHLKSILPAEAHGWVELDLLGAGCGCSHRVAQHLLERGRIAGLTERVLIAGEDKEMASWFHSKGWPVQSMRMSEAAELFGTHGAPYLVFVNDAGQVRYAGGYSPDRMTQTDFRDREIFKAVQAGRSVKPFPVFGCAVEKEIQKRMDPLGLKYGWVSGRS